MIDKIEKFLTETPNRMSGGKKGILKKITDVVSSHMDSGEVTMQEYDKIEKAVKKILGV